MKGYVKMFADNLFILGYSLDDIHEQDREGYLEVEAEQETFSDLAEFPTKYSVREGLLLKNRNKPNYPRIATKKNEFRIFRVKVFNAFDILKINSLVGIDTMLEELEISFYEIMLTFPSAIGETTEASEYPEVPARIRKYM